MPTYVVVDSDDEWLTVGDFSSPNEAVQDAMQASNFDYPSTIYVYEFINQTRFSKVERKGHPTYRQVNGGGK